jgi:hypothetical protein
VADPFSLTDARAPRVIALRQRADPDADRVRRAQRRVVATALVVLGAGSAWLAAHFGVRQTVLLWIGAACGLTLYHAAFGFTSAYRKLLTTGDARGVRAQLLMLAIATVLFAPLLAVGPALGLDVAGAVAPAGVSVMFGAFLFGIGMQLGGGCGSGTLFHLGGGSTPLALTLAGFVAGSVLATFHMPFWTALPSMGELSLGVLLGWPAAVAIQLGVLGALGVLLARTGRRAAVSPRAECPGWRTRLLHGPWSLTTGAVVLAVLNALTLVVAGHPWTITWAFTLWGGKLVQLAGHDLGHVPFWTEGVQHTALAAPVLADQTSVMDIGLMLGALLAAGLAGRFAPPRAPSVTGGAGRLLGGLLLGYGARIAFGCNIGALFSGIASTSLHGWLWGAAALLGTPLGVRLRAVFHGRPPAAS